MSDFTEKLIENVKKHDVLFNLSHPDYKNVRIKNKIWDEMAKAMGLGNTGDDLKKRWKNLRDCYSKYLRSEKTRTGQAAKSLCRYKAWPWAQHMEHFRPCLQFAETDSNVPDIAIEVTPEVESGETEVCRENKATSETPKNTLSEVVNGHEKSSTRILYNHNRKRKLIENTTSNSSSIDKVINYLDKKHTEIQPRYDDVDLIFQGYAASVKKMSPRRQTIIKFKFAKLIMEEELAQHAVIQEESRPGTSFSLCSATSSGTSNMRSPEDLPTLYNINEVSVDSSAETWYHDFNQSNI